MSKLTKGRGERALDTAIEAIDQARGTLVQRLDDIDIEAMRKSGNRLAGSLRSDLERRIRPRRRRISPWGVVGITGLVILGAAGVAVGYVAYDRERREEARRRLTGVRSRARERYAELSGGRTRAEADLEARVNEAIGAENGRRPEGLEVVVEGRTVYLRGAVADPASVDAAAERVHGVPGVVAVVNLTTGAAREQATQPS
jgi:osmotically-inducible protein OsmY